MEEVLNVVFKQGYVSLKLGSVKLDKLKFDLEYKFSFYLKFEDGYIS